jgi:hypothetical protein
VGSCFSCRAHPKTKLKNMTNTPTKAHLTKITIYFFFFFSERPEILTRLCSLPKSGNQDLPFRSWSTSSPGGKSEVPAMSSGDAPGLYPPNVYFPPGRLQVSKKRLLRPRSKHFGPLTSVFPKSSRCVDSFRVPWCASRHFLVFLVPEQPRAPSCCLG